MHYRQSEKARLIRSFNCDAKPTSTDWRLYRVPGLPRANDERNRRRVRRRQNWSGRSPLLLRFVSLVSQLCLTSPYSSGRRFARFSLWGKVWGLHACALTSSNIHAQPFQNLTLLFSCTGFERKDFRKGGRLPWPQGTTGSSPVAPTNSLPSTDGARMQVRTV